MLAAQPILSIGKATMVHILPARRVGRKRCSDKALSHNRRRSRLPPARAPAEHAPIWCPEGTQISDQIPFLMPIYAEMLMGGRTPPRDHAAARLPPLKVKARYEGRVTTVDAREGDTWFDVQRALAPRIHLAATEMVLFYDQQETTPAAGIPVADAQGHIRVDVCKLERPPGRRPAPRARSRTPSRAVMYPSATSVGVQTHLGVVDMESLYFHLKVSSGAWLLRLDLEECQAHEWRDVTAARACSILQNLYPTCFSQQTRLCLAVNNVLLRPLDRIVDHIKTNSDKIHLIPAPLCGAGRAQEWNFPSSSSEPSSEEEPPPHMYILWRTGTVWYPHRVHLDNMNELTWFQLERLFVTQHPQVRFWGRPIFANLSGQVLGLSTRIQPSVTPTLLAIPSPEFGGNVQDPFNEALQIAKTAAADCHKVSQLKLLLRGEPGLAQRLIKHSSDTKRCRAVLLDLTQRYGMSRQSQALSPPSAASEPKMPVAKVRDEPTNSSWKTVTSRRQQNVVTHSLIGEDWSVPIKTELDFEKEGVYFTESQAAAEALQRRMGRPSHAAAIVSLRPLAGARATIQRTFRALTTDSMGKRMEKTLTGFVNQIGDTDVYYRENILKIDQVAESATSVKIVVKAHRKYLDDKDWKSITAVVDRRTWSGFLLAHKLHCVDFWNHRCVDDLWSASVRVKQADLSAWMTADTVFTVALASPLADPYKVTWDADMTKLAEARKRYQGTPGFAGIIMGKDTLGVRIADKAFDAAMQYLGKPQGELFEVRGVPLQATEAVIEDLLLQAGWQAQLVAGFRRVVRGYAIFKVRSAHAPPCDILRTSFGGELVQIQLARLYQRRSPTPTQPPVASTPPSSWDASARQAIGVQKQTQHTEESHVVSQEDGHLDSNEDMQTDDEQTAAGDPPTSERVNWARRIREPAAKIRRTQESPESDPRIELLMAQVAKLTEVVSGLSMAMNSH